MRLNTEYVPSEEPGVLGDYYYEDPTGKSRGDEVADIVFASLATAYPDNETSVSYFGKDDSCMRVTVYA